MMRIAKWVVIALVALAASGLVFVLTRDSEPHTAAQIRLYTDLLNELAAVDMPHKRFSGA